MLPPLSCVSSAEIECHAVVGSAYRDTCVVVARFGLKVDCQTRWQAACLGSVEAAERFSRALPSTPGEVPSLLSSVSRQGGRLRRTAVVPVRHRIARDDHRTVFFRASRFVHCEWQETRTQELGCGINHDVDAPVRQIDVISLACFLSRLN